MDTSTKAEDEPTVTVHFSGGRAESRVCGLKDTVGSVKTALGAQLGAKADAITLSYSGEALSDATTLEQLAAEPGQDITLSIQVEDSIEVQQPTIHNKPVSDLLTVQVDDDREVLVKVERQSASKKPFLGGYKHRISGIEYHNAAAQTLPKRKPDNGIAKFQRDTQTVEVANRYQQATVDATTQMNKTGCFISDSGDRVVPILHKYETAEDYNARILGKVVILQSYWRQWLASRYVSAVREEKVLRRHWEAEQAARRERERGERQQREFQRRMNPRSKEDFDLLYHALEMWRVDELQRINATSEGAERKAALYALLEQEAQLIASIGQHRLAAGREGKDRAKHSFLNAAAAPKKWTAFDGKVTAMDTVYTLRAQQLRDIYNSITLESLSRDERLDVLLTLKCTVKEHDCRLTREIVELVDREADLLVRGMADPSLKGLRKRTATLFFQYCKTPLFNPEAARHIKVPQDPATLRSNVYYCRSCCQYLPSTDFELSTNARVVGHCRACKELDNQARAREDFSEYRAMLKAIRRAEEGRREESHFIFLIQEPDLRYLVENIWASQSALSACSDLEELVLVRWDEHKAWSPWNCVLLTKDEGQAHSKLENALEAYGQQFVAKVVHRHVLAKTYFSRVPEMQAAMGSKVKELPLPRSDEREIPAPVKTTLVAPPMDVHVAV